MRNVFRWFLLALLLPCSLSLATPREGHVDAQLVGADSRENTGPRGFLCEACRDFNEYPMDAVAFAYNGFFGDLPWMPNAGLGIPFRVYALDGTWVLVWFEGVLFDAPSLLPNLMDVLVRLPSGQVLTFTVLQNGPDMPVGGPTVSICAPDTDGGGHDEDGDDEYAEPDDEIEEIEFDDPIGVVEIIDPDEEGEFPEWEIEA